MARNHGADDRGDGVGGRGGAGPAATYETSRDSSRPERAEFLSLAAGFRILYDTLSGNRSENCFATAAGAPRAGMRRGES
jgi:hypothetical protein